eukprot:g4424.t1
MNYLLVLFAAFMMFIMVYMFLAAALEDSSAEANSAADHQHLSQPMQKIILNHAQLVSLASGFPLKWPAEIESMFQAMGMFGQAGSYMFNPACNGATVAGDINGEVVSMFFQKQIVMQVAPFIAIFFSCLFWTCVAIRDCVDPPSKRLQRHRRLRHYRKKRKAALKKHSSFHKTAASSKQKEYKKKIKEWKAELKLAKKNGVPEAEWPKKPEREHFKHEKTKFEYKTLKQMRRESLARKKSKKLDLKKLVETDLGQEGSNQTTKSKTKIVVSTNRDSTAAGSHSNKDIKENIDAPDSPNALKPPDSENAFDDYKETENHELLAQVKLFQGADSGKAGHKTIKDKIQEHMRVSAEMSKDSLGKYDKFVATNVTLMYLCYPVLIKSTFQLVACMPIGKNMYLQMDLNVPCYVGQHLFFTLNLFLPAFCCWVIGLPLSGFLIMKRNRHKLYERNMKFRYGTLYTGYTLQCYYWECVISIRKCFVLATSVFLTTAGAESQALCGMMICMVALIFHLHWKPFIKVAKGRHTLFWAEFWALFVAFLTFWTGLFFFQDVASSGPLQMFFTVELISVNSFFCLMAFRWFLILKLMDTQDLIMTRELQGAQEEELKGQRQTALAALGLGATNNALSIAKKVKERAERKAKRRSLAFRLVRKKGDRTRISPSSGTGSETSGKEELDPAELERRSRAKRKAMKKLRRVVKGIGAETQTVRSSEGNASEAETQTVRSSEGEAWGQGIISSEAETQAVRSSEGKV